tara:strand:+ start:29951 stop:33337 length:3387 start_codon:yes stop_codon:yes gene_type:complete
VAKFGSESGSESRQFSRITLATTALFTAVTVIVWGLGFLFDSPIAFGLGVLWACLLLPVTVLSHFAAIRGHVDRAVALVTTVWYLIAFCMIIVGERMYGVMIVTATLPVLMVLPFASQSMFRWLMVGSILIVATGSIAQLFPTLYTSHVPDDVMADIESFATTALLGVVMLSLWQSGGKLKAAAAGMREAIAALQESEKSLETKVEQRTAELNEAFREISDLNRIASIVNSTLDLEEVKRTIYDGLQKLFTFDQMGVFLVSPDDQRLRLVLQEGVPFYPEVQDLLMGEGLALEASDSFPAASVMLQETIYRGSVTPEGLAQAGTTDKFIYRHSPMKSFLLCPLVIENKAIGTIFFVATEEAFELRAREIESIERYVTQMGTAIRNGQLFQSAEEARAEAERANLSKGSFLANMSHEIRTPMNAIIGLTDLCLETDLTLKQQDYLTKVDGAANSLRTIIDDILDFSKLESGKLEFESVPFSLNGVLDNLATICMVRCQDKKLELVFQRDPTLPDTLLGDPTRLGQILINLAGNAIKFTEKGAVIVEIRQSQRSDETVTVHFAVRDSGIGMNEDQQARLFKSFSQADSTITRQYGGTGLGLAISQQLTQGMGGLVEVDSAQGEGSSFHFSLEFEIGEQAAEDEAVKQAPAGLNVLVVDDNEASRDILREYLNSFGYQATLAESGEEALTLIDKTEPFDLVLLDWMMPGMTGLDVALAIRDRKPAPKIVLLSSWRMPSSEHEAMVDAFLAKPIKPSSLLDTIMLAFGKQPPRRANAKRQSFDIGDLEPIRGARVLVVDDSEINLQIACELLQKVPLVVETASNGVEAVAKVRDNLYDCVLMDIQMPILDGYAATDQIRADGRFGELPILAMTANVMAEDRIRTREAGMNGHIAKPIEPRLLYQALLAAIPEGDYSGNLSPDASSLKSAVVVVSKPLPDALPGLNIKAGLARLAGNEKLFYKLLQDLLSSYADAPRLLLALQDRDELEQVRTMAHKLRGIANNLGAEELGACAEEMETRARENKKSSPHIIARMEDIFATLQSSMKALTENMAVATSREGVVQENVGELFTQLIGSVEACDPVAIDLLDKILASVKPGSIVFSSLAAPRELLDNFDFAGAAPLLEAIDLQAG